MTAILAAGFVAGILDGLAASVNAGIRGTSPVRVFQYIASALLGPASYSRGAVTVALGVALHFLIAFGAATVFVLVSVRFPILIRRAIICGAIYGVVVYFFMSRFVVPLSAARTLPFSVQQLLTGIGIHILFVGLPIVLVARKTLSSNP